MHFPALNDASRSNYVFAGLVFLCLLCLLIAGCESEPVPTGPRLGASHPGHDIPSYRLAIHPKHNPALLVEIYQPLVDYLNLRLKGCRIVVEASRDYSAFEDKYRTHGPELLLPNPWQTLQAMETGYRVIAMEGESELFKGIFIVRKKNGIHHPTDLKGKSVSYPAPTALAACIMPQLYLHDAGLKVLTDIDNRYVGSQESAIMNTYLGKTAAAGTWPVPWLAFQKDHPKEAAELEVAWETSPLINVSLMARDDLPSDHITALRQILFALPEDKEGRAILDTIGITRFYPAANKDYDLVRSFLERFEREVRPVEQP